MKTAAELYPDLVAQEYFYGPGDYSPILESLGQISIRVDDDDYQGDSRVLYRDGSRWGWLQFGWGSCSGCDALQACNSMSEIQSLMDSLRSQIQWFDSAAECLTFFREHDWEGDYSYHADEQRAFIERSIAELKSNM